MTQAKWGPHNTQEDNESCQILLLAVKGEVESCECGELLPGRRQSRSKSPRLAVTDRKSTGKSPVSFSQNLLWLRETTLTAWPAFSESPPQGNQDVPYNLLGPSEGQR